MWSSWSHDEGGFKGETEEGVGDTAVVLEAGDGAAEAPEGVDVRELGRDGHGEGGVGGAAVEARAGEAGSGEDVGDGLHGSYGNGREEGQGIGSREWGMGGEGSFSNR
jgi:hypothetical protein